MSEQTEIEDYLDDIGDQDEFETTDAVGCDHCSMSPGQVGPFGMCCACSIGQGASSEDCICGPSAIRPLNTGEPT